MRTARNLVIALALLALPAAGAGDVPATNTVSIGKEWGHQWTEDLPDRTTLIDIIAPLGEFGFGPEVAIVIRDGECCFLGSRDFRRDGPRIRIRNGDIVFNPETNEAVTKIEARFAKVLRGAEAVAFLRKSSVEASEPFDRPKPEPNFTRPGIHLWEESHRAIFPVDSLLPLGKPVDIATLSLLAPEAAQPPSPGLVDDPEFTSLREKLAALEVELRAVEAASGD